MSRRYFFAFIRYDFFVMYLVLELQSLSLYLLASLKRYSNLAVEAGLKYFIYGSLLLVSYYMEYHDFMVVLEQRVLIQFI
jgi:NADH:ubiquinone oxidoreductase subunit 2 (subunit N)